MEKTTRTLKPCPFCGGEATVYYAPGNDIEGIPCFGVACDDCKTMIGTVKDGTTDFYRTPQEAAEAWNTREPMDKIVEQLKEAAIKENVPAYIWDVQADYYLPLSKAIEIVKGGAE